jgi:ABC-2 type transport system permease protein
MTPSTDTAASAPGPTSRLAVRRSARRIMSLARGEATLLRRSLNAVLTALVLPVLLVFAQLGNASAPGSDSAGGLNRGALVVLSLAAFGVIFGIYYNLVTVFVARREQLVLKKFRTGEATDVEILSGTAAPAVAIAWGQIVIGAVAGAAFLGLGRPTNLPLVVLAVVMGTVVFGVLAALTAALTNSVETAPLTATPVVLASMLLSGLMFPVDSLPSPLPGLAQLVPLTPVVDLLRMGLAGIAPNGERVGLTGSFLPAVLPLLTLTAWGLVALWAGRRWFRWEPRR